MGYKHHGVNTGGIPVDYIKKYVDEWDIKVFIETGTAGGESVRAVAPLFRECHTIEVVGDRAEKDGATYPENVKLHVGDSAKNLHRIAEPYRGEKIFFWLDAHWSEPYESVGDISECPVLDEIQAISGHNCIIMIDDARLFYGAPSWPCNPTKGWPRFQDVFLKLKGCFPDYIVTVVDDYIIAFPDAVRDVHFMEWRGRFKERYPSEEERLKQSVKDTYNAFKKYIE